MGPAPIEGPTQVPTELTFEFFIYSKRIKSRDARKRAHDGDIYPCPFMKGARGRWYLFMKMSLVISWFTKFELKQIYCNYSRTWKFQDWFSIFSGNIFEVNIVAEQKQA